MRALSTLRLLNFDSFMKIIAVKGTVSPGTVVSPAEICDLVGVKLEDFRQSLYKRMVLFNTGF